MPSLKYRVTFLKRCTPNNLILSRFEPIATGKATHFMKYLRKMDSPAYTSPRLPTFESVGDPIVD